MSEIPKASGFAARLTARWMLAAFAAPRRALGLLAVLVGLAGLAATGLGIDTDSSRMLDPALPDQRRAHALNEAFPELKGTILVVVRAGQADAADAGVAALVPALSGEAAIASVFAPSVDPFFAAHGFLYKDTEEVGTLFARLSQSANLLARLRAEPTLDGFFGALAEAGTLVGRAEIEPAVLDRLYGETAAVLADRGRAFGWSELLDDADGPVTRLISVLPRPDTTRLNPARPALDAIAHSVAAADLAPGVTIGVTGEPALRAEEMRSVTATIGLSLAASLVLVVLILRVGLMRWRRVGVAGAALLATLVLTTGVAALTVGALNLISIAFVVLMVGLGIDFAIHTTLGIAEARAGGADPRDAVRLTAARAGQALLLSAVTTAAAFLAFTGTDFVGMAQLGLIGAAGVMIAWAVALTMIPATLALVPGPVPAPVVASRRARSPGWLAIVVLLAGIALTPFAFEARFDADPMGLRNPAAPSVLAFHALAGEAGTTPYRASVLTAGPEESAAVKARLEAAPGIGRVATFADLVPDDQQAKLDLLDLTAPSLDHALAGTPGDLTGKTVGLADFDPGRARPAAARLAEALATYRAARTPESDAALTERLFRHFPAMLDRLGAMLEADFVTADALPETLARRFRAPDGTERVDIAPDMPLRDPADFAAFAEAVRAAAPEAAGGPVQLAAAAKSVSSAMLGAVLIAAALTLVFAFLATRRVAVTLAILLPLVLAGIATAAFSALAGIPFNYANVIVLPLMIGMGVDSGIHLALAARDRGDLAASLTPRAVLFSALTTLAAFATLGVSDHRGTASMGILLAVSMLATLGAVFAVTPALIRWTGGDVKARGSTEGPSDAI